MIRAGFEAEAQTAFTGQTLTKSTMTIINTVGALTTEVLDVEGWWDTTNYKFLPKKEGWYLLGGILVVDGMEDGKKYNLQTMIYRPSSSNTSYTLVRGVAGGADIVGVSGTALVYMNGNDDYVQLRFYHNCTVDIAIRDADNRSAVFYGYYVGEDL